MICLHPAGATFSRNGRRARITSGFDGELPYDHGALKVAHRCLRAIFSAEMRLRLQLTPSASPTGPRSVDRVCGAHLTRLSRVKHATGTRQAQAPFESAAQRYAIEHIFDVEMRRS